MVSETLKQTARRLLPSPVYARAAVWWRRHRIRFGALRRLDPFSRRFGIDRGKPIDRYFIEPFLEKYGGDILGRVLEIGDSRYTRMFGAGRVTRSDVLHAVQGNPEATLVGSLETGEGIPDNAFNCMILTQVLHVIYDVKAAIANCFRALKPGGVLLVTFPGISQISRYDMDRWGDYWRLTSLSARRLFEEAFPAENVTVEAWGNVLVAVAFLHGLAADELRQKELDYRDPDYEVLITVRAVKPRGNHV